AGVSVILLLGRGEPLILAWRPLVARPGSRTGDRASTIRVMHSPMHAHPRLAQAAFLSILAFVLVGLAQLPLVSNPGYFSHDELQWAAYAAAGVRIDWLAFDTFQYRPLTFTTWTALSRAL